MWPHHMQQEERMQSERIRVTNQWNVHHNWGLRQLDVDPDAFKSGRLVILRLRARLKDGTLVEVPAEGRLPALASSSGWNEITIFATGDPLARRTFPVTDTGDGGGSFFLVQPIARLAPSNPRQKAKQIDRRIASLNWGCVRASIVPVVAGDRAIARQQDGIPRRLRNARSNHADAAVGQPDVHTGGVTRLGPPVVAFARRGIGLEHQRVRLLIPVQAEVMVEPRIKRDPADAIAILKPLSE